MPTLKGEHRYLEALDLDSIPREVTSWDEETYAQITSVDLTAEQEGRVSEPTETYPKQKNVLAVHWHPEFVPLPLIHARVDALFPNRESELIIPTQHNELMTWDGYSGVEIDCYSSGFNLKVQLLTHFAAEKVAEATVLKSMLDHTFKYRSSQLFEFIDSVLDPVYDDRVQRAAAKTGATQDLVEFVRIYVSKIKALIDRNEATTPPAMLKNKILRNYFNALRDKYDGTLIDHAQVFLQRVKKIVKEGFSLAYFYRTEEIIEEVRSLGGGIVIPHPEQFWPILLADYDIDGIEVWNPQSQQYTEFLINAVNQQNRSYRRDKPLLIFMGDDTHFGEKVIEPRHQDPDKARRELGVQPAWDDLMIRKSLIVAKTDRQSLIAAYKERLA